VPSIATADELERDVKRKDADHAIWLRHLVCGIGECVVPAHRWQRCKRCHHLVPRCIEHEHRFADQVAEHCPA
jgi:hypothetical protein